MSYCGNRTAPLQPLSGETFAYRSAIVGDEARLDIKAPWFLEPNTGRFPGCESISPKCAMLSLHRHRHHPEATWGSQKKRIQSKSSKRRTWCVYTSRFLNYIGILALVDFFSVLINAWANTLRHDCGLHIAHVHKNVCGSRYFAYFFFHVHHVLL